MTNLVDKMRHVKTNLALRRNILPAVIDLRFEIIHDNWCDDYRSVRMISDK
jgi:hypothetical protein